MKNRNGVRNFKQSDLDDLKALQGIKNGNQHAYTQIYKKYYGHLYIKALRSVRNRAQAEDLIQEVFIKVFNDPDTYRQDFTFNTWLSKVANNYIIDYIRQRNRNPEYHSGVSLDSEFGNDSETDITSIEVPSHYPNVMEADFTTVDNVRMNYVIKVINTLPDIEKEILTLYYVERRKYVEICDVLKLKMSTVKLRIKRARENMMKKVNLAQAELEVEKANYYDLISI